jgi:hypothetical protein
MPFLMTDLNNIGLGELPVLPKPTDEGDVHSSRSCPYAVEGYDKCAVELHDRQGDKVGALA